MRSAGRLNLGVPAPLGSLFLLLLVLLVACGEPVATPEPVFLQATGSTAMSPLLSDLVAAFEESSPLISLEVSGLGTQFGLEAFRAGEADLALVSWLPAELDSGWRATAIARDAIAVVVHPSNPVKGLGLLQLQDLFGGRVYEWAGVLGVESMERLTGGGYGHRLAVDLGLGDQLGQGTLKQADVGLDALSDEVQDVVWGVAAA